MKSGIFLLAVSAVIFAVLATYEMLLQQPVSASLAVEQLSNDEIPAAAMRGYSAMRNLAEGVAIGFAAFGMTLLVFTRFKGQK